MKKAFITDVYRERRKMSEKKEKFTYWLEPSLVDEMSSMLSEANATSKGEFVRQSIKFYMAYLRQKKSIDFISPLLAQTIKNEIESVEHNLSEMLFKVAVEQAKLSNIVAWQNQLDDQTIKRLHDICAHDVAQINGIISFEDAYKFQHGE